MKKKISKKPEPRPLLLSVDQVAEQLSVSTRTVWRMVSAGTLPQPIRYNRKLVRWKMSDLQKYIDQKR